MSEGFRSYADRIADAFYRWEIRGRGWTVFQEPVDLEPPFRRCSFPQRLAPAVDEGRRVGLLKRLLGSADRVAPQVPSDETEPSPESSPSTNAKRRVLRISVPQYCRVAKLATERLLTSLGAVRAPVSFEFIGHANRLLFQVSAAAEDAVLIEQLLRAFMPDASIMPDEDALSTIWPRSGWRHEVVDFGLAAEFVVPLRIPAAFDPHPLAGTFAALAGLGSSEAGILQILMQPVRHPWAAETMRAVLGPSGDGLFEDAPQMVSQARDKTAAPLFAAVIRVGVAEVEQSALLDRLRAIASTLAHLGSPAGNSFISLPNDNYPGEAHAADILARTSRRSGMILNVQEVACLVHPPDDTVHIEGIDREMRRSVALPLHLRDRQGVLLGVNRHRGIESPVRITREESLRHAIILGASGTGKSTLLANLILQELENGTGVAVLDPHGDLVEEIAGRMPRSRIEDVTYIDPSEARGCVPVNILSARSETERTVLSVDLASVLRRFVANWGDQMNALLGAAVATVLEADPNGTLVDLRRLLVDAAYRNALLLRVHDAEALFYWNKTFPHAGSRAIGPLLGRLDTFLRPKPVRAVVAGAGAGLDVTQLLDGGVLLARLAQGLIGEENAHLLGGLIAARINQAALARQQHDRSSRRPFILYVDEAHALACASMASLLSGGRKHGIGIVLCHQEWDQWRHMPEVGNAILANAHTRILLRLGEHDAKRFADSMTGFVMRDFVNLRTGEAIARVGDATSSFNLHTPQLAAPTVDPARRRAEVIERSAARYELLGQKDSVADVANALELEAPPVRTTTNSPTAFQELSKNPKLAGPPKGGRGGREHRYLQHLVKRLAEERGFRAVIEEDIGGARVDVALYRGGTKIACQIALSSPPGYEAKAVAKCFERGFSQVLVLGTDAERLNLIENACRSLVSAEWLEHVKLGVSNDIVGFLNDLVNGPLESVVRGYRVHVSRRKIAPEHAEAKHKAISEVMARSLLRNKSK